MNELGVEDQLGSYAARSDTFGIQLGIFNTRSPGGELSAIIYYYRRVP